MVDGGRAGRKVDPTYSLEELSAWDRSLRASASRSHGNRGNTKRWEEGTPQGPPNLVSMVEMVAWTRPQAKNWVPAKTGNSISGPGSHAKGSGGRTSRDGDIRLGRL